MSWTLISILVLASATIVLRFGTWWVVRLVSGFFNRSVDVLSEPGVQENISGLASRFEQAFPKTAKIIFSRLTPRSFSGLPLTLIVIAGLYLVALLGGLIEDLLEAEELVQFDLFINQQLDRFRSDNMITIFAWITDLGGSAALIAVTLVTTGLLWAPDRWHLIVPLWLTDAGSQLTTIVGKYAFARERPEAVADVAAIMPSFPSGHATSALAVYGFITHIITRQSKTQRQRFELVYWGTVLIALIGFSRMLLGVHYASDIAAGFLVGGFWLLVGFALAEYRHHQ